MRGFAKPWTGSRRVGRTRGSGESPSARIRNPGPQRDLGWPFGGWRGGATRASLRDPTDRASKWLPMPPRSGMFSERGREGRAGSGVRRAFERLRIGPRALPVPRDQGCDSGLQRCGRFVHGRQFRQLFCVEPRLQVSGRVPERLGVLPNAVNATTCIALREAQPRQDAGVRQPLLIWASLLRVLSGQRPAHRALRLEDRRSRGPRQRFRTLRLCPPFAARPPHPPERRRGVAGWNGDTGRPADSVGRGPIGSVSRLSIGR